MRSRVAGIGAVVALAVLVAACNPQQVEVSYNQQNTGGCSSIVLAGVRYRYDGPSPTRIVVRNPDGSLVRAGLAVSGQTFAVGSYTTGGCPSPPPDVPPAVVLTLRLEVTADNGAGTLTGNLTPEPSLYCPLAVQTCSVDPTPLWRP